MHKMIKHKYKNMAVCQSCKMIAPYTPQDIHNYENVGFGIVCNNCGEIIFIENKEE